MNEESINLEALSTRAGFNSAVRHINKTLEISEGLRLNNLGDMLYESGEDLSGERGALLLRMLLIDKLGYKAVSANLGNVVADVPGLGRVFEKWKAVDLVAAYHHPDMGLLIANPKAVEELSRFGTLRKRELLVIYAGKGGAPTLSATTTKLATPSDETCQKAAELALALFEGRKVKVPPEFLKGNFTAGKPRKAAQSKSAAKKAGKAPPATRSTAQSKKAKAQKIGKAESQAPSASPSRMTPMYSVAVTNECFHNGNVEAWKRIIESYNNKYPDLRVYIYYEGERIIDINTLFKWGKVKHGSSIQFAIAGDAIKDVSKLQRYLAHGASPRFEDFLFASPGMVLNLFG